MTEPFQKKNEKKEKKRKIRHCWRVILGLGLELRYGLGPGLGLGLWIRLWLGLGPRIGLGEGTGRASCWCSGSLAFPASDWTGSAGESTLGASCNILIRIEQGHNYFYEDHKVVAGLEQCTSKRNYVIGPMYFFFIIFFPTSCSRWYLKLKKIRGKKRKGKTARPIVKLSYYF